MEVDYLKQTISDLINLSLETESTSIVCRVCLDLLWFQIVDNGLGATKGAQLGRNKDLQNHNTLLYKIAQNCEELIVESYGLISKPNHMKVFQCGIPLNDNSIEAKYCSTRESAGTTITLKNLFHYDNKIHAKINKQRAIKDLVSVIRDFAIINFGISISICDITTCLIIFNSDKADSLLNKILQIFDLRACNLQCISCKKDDVVVTLYYWQRKKQFKERIKHVYENNSKVECKIVLDLIKELNFQANFIFIIEYPLNSNDDRSCELIKLNCIRKCLTDDSVIMFNSNLNNKASDDNWNNNSCELLLERTFYDIVTSQDLQSPERLVEQHDDGLQFGQESVKQNSVLEWLNAKNNIHLPYSEDDFPNDLSSFEICNTHMEVNIKKTQLKKDVKNNPNEVKKCVPKRKKEMVSKNKNSINITEEIKKLFHKKNGGTGHKFLGRNIITDPFDDKVKNTKQFQTNKNDLFSSSNENGKELFFPTKKELEKSKVPTLTIDVDLTSHDFNATTNDLMESVNLFDSKKKKSKRHKKSKFEFSNLSSPNIFSKYKRSHKQSLHVDTISLELSKQLNDSTSMFTLDQQKHKTRERIIQPEDDIQYIARTNSQFEMMEEHRKLLRDDARTNSANPIINLFTNTIRFREQCYRNQKTFKLIY